MTWNINGWTELNKEIRSKVIEHVNPDICCLLETHCKDHGNLKVELPHYVSIDLNHNRVLMGMTTGRTHGGISMLIKESLLQEFRLSVLDNSIDDYIMVNLKNKVTSHSINLHCAYLKPENSVWNNNDDIYQTMLTNVYSYSDCDRSIILGDFNARLGSKVDFIPNVDNINEREVLDLTENKQGADLLDLLLDSKHCILNGRIGKQSYTCIKPKGRSVVDYITCDHLSLPYFSNFECLTPENQTDLIQRDTSFGRRVSDHSLLLADLIYVNSFEVEYTCENVKNNKRIFQLYKSDKSFMNNDNWSRSIVKLIDRLSDNIESQCLVDQVYQEMLETVNREMEEYVPYTDLSKQDSKCLKYFKPYWDDKLQSCWKTFYAEKSKKNCNANLVIVLRNKFDKMLRQKERKYLKNKAVEIECADTKNPNRFWNYIRSLGPSKKSKIPFCVQVGDTLIHDEKVVLDAWKDSFNNLYKKPDNVWNSYDHNFYDHCLKQIQSLETFYSKVDMYDEYLNKPFTANEIDSALDKLKDCKATGIDLLKNEVIRNLRIRPLIIKLCQFCFSHSVTPSKWRTGIISPIPKGFMKCKYDPNCYRGLMLLCTLEKAYTSVLNNRFCEHMMEILVDEQGGFRKGYSCLDQAFILSTVIGQKLENNESVFAVFIDLKKYFDWINRKLLCLKLLYAGVHGRFYYALKSIYKATFAQVNIHDNLSQEFEVVDGLMQGETFSPSLASLYLNDFAIMINSFKLGVNCGPDCISILLYADDIVLLSNSELDMQIMLNSFHQWCTKWQCNYNIDKTKVIHFCKRNVRRSSFKFQLGDCFIEFVNMYKYLGFFFDEFLEYKDGVSILSHSGGRALSTNITKCKSNPHLSFATFTKLYNSCVIPIITYFSAIWGHDEYSDSFAISKRGLKFYLSLPRYCSTAALMNISGWYPPYITVLLKRLGYIIVS